MCVYVYTCTHKKVFLYLASLSLYIYIYVHVNSRRFSKMLTVPSASVPNAPQEINERGIALVCDTTGNAPQIHVWL